MVKRADTLAASVPVTGPGAGPGAATATMALGAAGGGGTIGGEIPMALPGEPGTRMTVADFFALDDDP